MTEGERLETLAAHAAKRLQRAAEKFDIANAELAEANRAASDATAALARYRKDHPVEPGKLF